MTDCALDDLRVIDLAGEIGVYATKLLADLGADVIRIEPPNGDPLREIGPWWHDERAVGRSLSFLNNNTNKRSVTLDITKPDGRALFEKLVGTADVVVETYEPGYMDSLGLGYAALSARKPDIIVTSVTGFGQTGPHAHYKWSDIVGVAMSGMMTLAGDKDDPPNMPASSQGYVGASIQAAAGTLMALMYRDQTGAGQHVDVSMQEALSINQETAMQTYDMMRQIRTRTGARGAIPIDLPGLGTFECADGHVFAYLGTPGGAPWTVMLEWMNREGLAEDLNDEPYVTLVGQLNLRFLTTLMSEPEKLPERLKALSHMHGVFSRFCKSMSKWKIYEEGQQQRLMFGIVSTPEDIAKSPQLEHRHWLQDVRHEETGETLRYPGPPYRLFETPWSIRRRPPLPGEHNVEVFGELGVQAAELSALQAKGVV
jgi:crotonobetainyl-CoA:carnitine CoA-transferase CaiB-like acyl-CoA transferase